MVTVELRDISAKISCMLTRWSPFFIKVDKIVNKNIFETSFHGSPVSYEDFFPGDCGLTEADKAKAFIQLHRSIACHMYVLSFAQALKSLADTGIDISHQGARVVDIWVLNTNGFDITDIPKERVITLRDPVSGVSVPALSTYKNKDELREHGAAVCARLGFQVPGHCDIGEVVQKHYPAHYHGSVPHWWIAAIVGDGESRRMVHIDICGAAYDNKAFFSYDGELTSLLMFVTPEYNLIPGKVFSSRSTQDLSHKFLMESHVASTYNGQRMVSLQPPSVRHLRCFHRKDNSTVEITPLETFIERNLHAIPEHLRDWGAFVREVRRGVILALPAGAEVRICNLQKRPELNGRIGRVHDSVTNDFPKERVPLWVDGIDHPLKIKPVCIRMTEREQYSSLEEMSKKAEGQNEPLEAAELDTRPVSKKERAKIRRALNSDAGLSQTLDVLLSGKVTVSFFADPQFVQGIRKLLSAPYDKILPGQLVTTMRKGLEIADHPKSAEAFKILKLFRTAKQKALAEDPNIMQGCGAVAVEPGSDFSQLFEKIVQRINADKGLTEIFDMMDRNGLFPNPTTQLGVT